MVGGCALQKDMFVAPGTNAVKDKLNSSKLQVGTEYKLNGSTTLKAKLTANQPGGAEAKMDPVAIDIAVITKLEGKSSCTFTLQNKGPGKGTGFGATYTLEA